jgi:hypothetical protein
MQFPLHETSHPPFRNPHTERSACTKAHALHTCSDVRLQEQKINFNPSSIHTFSRRESLCRTQTRGRLNAFSPHCSIWGGGGLTQFDGQDPETVILSETCGCVNDTNFLVKTSVMNKHIPLSSDIL